MAKLSYEKLRNARKIYSRRDDVPVPVVSADTTLAPADTPEGQLERLQHALRLRGIPSQLSFRFNGKTVQYVADLYLKQSKIIVEVSGGLLNPGGPVHRWLDTVGYQVFRITSDYLTKNMDVLISSIALSNKSRIMSVSASRRQYALQKRKGRAGKGV